MAKFIFHCFFHKGLPSSCYADINCSDQQLFCGLSIGIKKKRICQGCIFFTAQKIMPQGWKTFCLTSDNKKLPILDCETTSGSLPHPVYQMRQYLPHCLTSRIVWNDLWLTSSSRVSNEAISPSLLHLKDSVKRPPAHFLIPSIKWGNISLTALPQG